MIILKQAAAGASALALDKRANATIPAQLETQQSTPQPQTARANTRHIPTDTRKVPEGMTRMIVTPEHFANTAQPSTIRSMRPDPRHTRKWRSRRAQFETMINNHHDIRCWRCNQPITPGQTWHLGHTRDQANGGTIGETWPEHEHENLAAGGRLGAERRWTPEPLPSRAL